MLKGGKTGETWGDGEVVSSVNSEWEAVTWLKIKEKLLNVNFGVSSMIYISDVRGSWIKCSASDEMCFAVALMELGLPAPLTLNTEHWLVLDLDRSCQCVVRFNDQSEAAVSKNSAVQTWFVISQSESQEDNELLKCL